MGFLEEFCLALTIHPIKALVAAYWYITRRRVRGRNQLWAITSGSPRIYRNWIRTVEQEAELVANAPAIMSGWQNQPLISFILWDAENGSSDAIAALLRSIEAQCYEKWELLLVGMVAQSVTADPRIRRVAGSASPDRETLCAALMEAKGDFIMPLNCRALLSPAALFRCVEALQGAPTAAILYGDHDAIAENGERSTPWFKPRWNKEMFLAQDYLSQACLIRTDVARAYMLKVDVESGAFIYALLLEVSASADAVVAHVPHIMAHYPDVHESASQAERVDAVARHVARHGGSAYSGPFDTVRVEWPLPDPLPKVSIIIPTRDKPELLKTCVTSLTEQTTYGNYEIVIVDNGSIEPETASLFRSLSTDPRISIINYAGDFNFSAINNHAVSHCSGDYVCLLNNDTEVVEGGWLTELMRYAVRDEVGAVGAKLLYPDKTIQHAGVVIGMGGAAGHAHRNLQNDMPGYFRRAHVSHRVSAVTAACLLVSRRKYEAVGGLDAQGFVVAFNDVEFCLKLEKAGWNNIYVPQAVLIHHESKSRGSDMLACNIGRFRRELNLLQSRWNTVNYADPLHHPHLDRASETYIIRFFDERSE